MIYDDITAYLSGEYRKGKTWQQIGNEHGLSFSYVRDLAQRRRRVEGITLETFFKLFPSAQISLTGAVPSAVQVEPAAAVIKRGEALCADQIKLKEKVLDLGIELNEVLKERCLLLEENLKLKARLAALDRPAVSASVTPPCSGAKTPVASCRAKPVLSTLSPLNK